MNRYVLLLRGINVSGQKKIKMDALKKMLEKLDFKDVKTYIQSGNAVFKTMETSVAHLEKRIGECLLRSFGFEVHVLIIVAHAFESIIQKAPFISEAAADLNNAYFVLLKHKPDFELVKALSLETYPNERFIITEECIYLSCQKGYGKAKCNTNFFERKLKTQATTRNYKTMMKLWEMSKEMESN